MTGDGLSRGLSDMWRSVVLFLPLALAFVAILIVGYLLARLARTVTGKALRRVGFDRAVQRGPAARVFREGAVSATDVCARLAFFVVLLIAFQLAFGLWGPNPASDLINALIGWLPQVFVAIVIVVVAAAVAGAAHDLIVAALGGLGYARVLAKVVAAVIVTLGVIAALDQVGIATSVTRPLLITILATMAGVIVVGVGGGLIRPMQQRWEVWLDRAATESAAIRQQARAYAEERARLAEEEEARRAEEIRLAEEARLVEEARVAEEARQAELARRAEEERQAEARRVEEERLAEARRMEEERLAEARRVKEERQAEARRVKEERQAEARRAKEERQAEARRAEQEREAEILRAAEARRAEGAKRAEDARRAEEVRRAEEIRVAEERWAGEGLAERQRRAEAARREQERGAQEPGAEERAPDETQIIMLPQQHRATGFDASSNHPTQIFATGRGTDVDDTTVIRQAGPGSLAGRDGEGSTDTTELPKGGNDAARPPSRSGGDATETTAVAGPGGGDAAETTAVVAGSGGGGAADATAVPASRDDGDSAETTELVVGPGGSDSADTTALLAGQGDGGPADDSAANRGGAEVTTGPLNVRDVGDDPDLTDPRGLSDGGGLPETPGGRSAGDGRGVTASTGRDSRVGAVPAESQRIRDGGGVGAVPADPRGARDGEDTTEQLPDREDEAERTQVVPLPPHERTQAISADDMDEVDQPGRKNR